MFPTGVQPHSKTSMSVVLEKTREAVLTYGIGQLQYSLGS